MKLAIFTIVRHSLINNKYYGYGPYIREINFWNKFSQEVFVLGPRKNENRIDPLDLPYNHENLIFVPIPNFNVLNTKNFLLSILKVPVVFIKCLNVMTKADHIHIRCPGNVSLVACFAQIFFPSKSKSTRYAGNWDPKSKQPMTYKLQKAILKNRCLTKNMRVLVYGEWPNEPDFIQPFIAATYGNNEKVNFKSRNYNDELSFVFAGSLVHGKRPLLTIKIIERLKNKGINAVLHMFGDGPLRQQLEDYIAENGLEKFIFLYGNQNKEKVKSKLINAHFSILPSKSEGWPKAIAEGMFFGCIPIATRVSCIPWMFDYGKRGILIEPSLEDAEMEILKFLSSKNKNSMAERALNWSQQYTLNRLEEEIERILNS